MPQHGGCYRTMNYLWNGVVRFGQFHPQTFGHRDDVAQGHHRRQVMGQTS